MEIVEAIFIRLLVMSEFLFVVVEELFAFLLLKMSGLRLAGLEGVALGGEELGHCL